jgi:hypothetical protein
LVSSRCQYLPSNVNFVISSLHMNDEIDIRTAKYDLAMTPA